MKNGKEEDHDANTQIYRLANPCTFNLKMVHSNHKADDFGVGQITKATAMREEILCGMGELL